VLDLPTPQAKKALQKFPGIGAPGAEKILLFSEACAAPAFESNGLRVLIRLGYGDEKDSYDRSYRHGQRVVGEGLEEDGGTLRRAYLVLRRHGQELCRRTKPACDACPVKEICAYCQRL